MGFRDDNEALRQRVQKLEDELEEALGEIEVLRNPPKVRVEVEEVDPGGSGSSLAAKVAAKESAERSARERRDAEAQTKREKDLRRLIAHGSRVKVTRAGSETILDVAPGSMRDQLIEQMGFGFFFAAINPGVFIVPGMAALLAFGVFDGLSFGAAFGIAIPLWLTILVMINLLYANAMRPRFRIAFDDENFEAKQMGSEAKSFLGRRDQLEVRVDEKAPGEVRLSASSGRMEIGRLIQEDLDAIRELLA